jgi:tetratricopeptide (TPR) repeat protein
MSSHVSDQLINFLSEWNARRADGRPCRPEDVCPDDPSLQRQLAEHIAAIERVEGHRQAFAGLGSDDDTPHAGAMATVATTGLLSPPGLQIQDELGRGGMGVVFRAVQRRLNRTVALKMILSDRPPERAEVTRFLAEAEAMAAVRHPNVAQVFDCGEHDGRPYLAMELLTGGTLKERLPAKGMRAAAAAELVERLAHGVEAAHAAGIVHRDLKPGNVLFDAADTPKVTDFGLAKRGGRADLTRTNAVVGTPAYMSPEQARGDTKFAGPPADVWALGVMLYECLTGRRPFTAPDPVGLLHQVVYADPPGVRAVVKTLPADLDQIVRKCLSKEPHERYPTAGGLADDLRNWLDGKPISARPLPAVVRVWKWTRRNPIPSGLILAVLVALTAVSGFFWMSSEAARSEAARVQADLGRANAETDKVAAELLAQREREEAQAESIRKGHLARAVLASQRGAAKEAIAAYDEAVAAGAALSDEQKIDRAGKLFDITAPHRREYLLSIDPDKLPKELGGRWHLINGFDLIGRDEEQATAELTRAIEFLPPDSWGVPFAKSLMEPDTEKALALLATAVDRNPAAIDPRHMQMFILFMSGRFADVIDKGREARPLAPDDPQVALLLFMSHAARKEKAEAKKMAAVMRKEFPPDMVDVLELAAPLFLGSNVTQPSDLLTNRDFLWFVLQSGLPKVQKAMTFLGGDVQNVEGVFRRSPRCIQPVTRLFGHLARRTLAALDPKNLLKGVQPLANGGLLTDEQFAELKAYAPTSPEGFVRFWYAGEMMVRNKYAHAGGLRATSRRLLAPEALAVAEQYEAGWRAKGFLFDARGMCLQGAILYYTIAALGLEWNGDYDAAAAKKAAALIRETLNDPAVKGGPLGYMGPVYYVQVALTAGDPALALAILERWRRDNPNDQRTSDGWALFHYDQKNWEAVRMYSMMTLEYAPEHAPSLKMFRESGEHLRRLGQAGY